MTMDALFRFSRKTQLALEAVVDVAYNARPDPVQSKEITERQGIPQRYLEQVMQHLVHAGILKGVRGPKGGYRLARERRRVTVGEIVRLVAALESADEHGQESQSELNAQVIQPLMKDAYRSMMLELDKITIEELCHRAARAEIGAGRQEASDFTI